MSPAVKTSLLQNMQDDDDSLEQATEDPIASRNLNSLSAAYETASALTASNPPLVGSGAVSVVPDLMQVYENMKKSSTPQDVVPGSAAAALTLEDDDSSTVYHGHAYYEAKQQQEQKEQLAQQQQQQWMDDGSNTELTVPPIPEEALAALSQSPPPILTTATARASMAASQLCNTSTSSASAPTVVRRNNKRSQAAMSKSDSNNNDTTTTSSASESDDNAADSSGRSTSRRKTKKDKGKDKADGRWSKRFTWPEDLHRDFCSAIFDVGLKHASPTQVLEFMPTHPDINSERIKSHLQKYRIHRTKSKQEFMSSFDTTLQNLKKSGIDPAVKSLAGGEVAAYLTYSEFIAPGSSNKLVKGGRSSGSMVASQQRSESTVGAIDRKPAAAAAAATTLPAQGCLVLPRLSDAEKNSPLGTSLGYLMGLFFSLKQQLMVQRAIKAGQVHIAPARMVPHQPMTLSLESVKPSIGDTAGISMSKGLGLPPESLPEGATATQRSNLEESTLMKREMDNQMAFQNKMRALKQQELNKYRSTSAESETGTASAHVDDRGQQHQSYNHHHHHHHQPQHHDHQQYPHQQPLATATAPVDHPHEDGTAANYQGAGEYPDQDARTRGVSYGGPPDDFWNADMMDDQLFEFLMNN